MSALKALGTGIAGIVLIALVLLAVYLVSDTDTSCETRILQGETMADISECTSLSEAGIENDYQKEAINEPAPEGGGHR